MDLITWRQDSQKNFNTILFKSKTFLDDMGSNWGQSFDILNLFWNLQFKFYNFMIYNLKLSLIMFTSIQPIFNLAISRIEKWKLPRICINYMHQWLACLLQIHTNQNKDVIYLQPAGIYLLQVDNGNPRTMCKLCLKWPSVFFVNF